MSQIVNQASGLIIPVIVPAALSHGCFRISIRLLEAYASTFEFRIYEHLGDEKCDSRVVLTKI